VSAERWSVIDRAGVRLVRCEAFGALAGVGHGFSTRQDARGRSFDLGGAGDTDAEVLDRRAALLEAIGLHGRRPTLLRQVHGAVTIDVATPFAAPPAADAVIAVRDRGGENWAPSVRWADCVPLLVASRDAGALAAVHAGWRGIAAGVVDATLASLQREDFPTAGALVAVGPAVGACCYEVAEPVAAVVAHAAGVAVDAVARRRGAAWFLDLRHAVRLQLERAGVAPAAVHVAPWCTACSPDLFFSHRREGAAAGRQMASIGWRPRP
jgi:hypothetical protein